MRRKQIGTIFALVAFCTQMALADTETVNGIAWHYQCKGGEAWLGDIEYYNYDAEIGEWEEREVSAIAIGTDGAVCIPDRLGGCPVTAIQSWAFYNCSEIESLSIPASVSRIEGFAFNSCDKLESVNVAQGNQRYFSIDGVLFDRGTSTLLFYPHGRTDKAYLVPPGTKSIGAGAFSGYSGFLSVSIPEGVTNISSWAFENCSGLANITIPKSTKDIARNAFFGCRKLAAFNVAAGNPSYKSLDGVLFSADGKRLEKYPPRKLGTSYAIPGGVTAVVTLAFEQCQFLESVSVPKSLVRIEREAFSGSEKLFDRNSNTNVLLVGDWAVGRQNNAKAIDLAGVRGIADGAFEGCGDLRSVTIPMGMEFIGEDAFRRCFEEIETYVWDPVSEMDYPVCLRNCSIIIPDSVTNIGSCAFAGCSGLSSVTIGKGISILATSVFAACPLVSVVIPDSVTVVGEEAFRYCRRLESVTIPDSVTTVKASAFYNCDRLYNENSAVWSVDGWVVGGKLGSVYSEVESGYYERNTISILNARGIADDAFSGFVPNRDEEGNRDDEIRFQNRDSLEIVTIGDTVKRIGTGAFRNCEMLTTMSMGKGVQDIGDSVFDGCGNMRGLSIGSGVVRIGACAFRGCTSATEIILPASLEQIGDNAFDGCSGVGSLTIGTGVVSIGAYAFRGIAEIPSIVIPDSVQSIGRYAFAGCDGATEISLGSNVNTLDGTAFVGCYGVGAFKVNGNNAKFMEKDGILYTKNGKTLVKCPGGHQGGVVIPKGTVEIGPSAFSGCYAIDILEIPSSVTSIGAGAFDGCDNLRLLTLPSRFVGKTSGMGIPGMCIVSFYEEEVFFTVTLDGNGASSGRTASAAISSKNGGALPANSFMKTGFRFQGWATTKNGSTVYADRAAIKAKGDMTLYAVWVPILYKVAFNANGGELPKGKKMKAQTMTYGKAATLRKNVFQRKDYVFAGWAVSKAKAKKGVIAYANAQKVKNLRSDGKTTTLYAVWAKPTYKIRFIANTGKGTMAEQTLEYGKPAKLTANKYKAPKGKKFAGWAKSKADAKKGKIAYKNKKSVKNLLTTGKTVKLYAVWKK